MKKILISVLTAAVVAAGLTQAAAEHLVILHTNDTHSAIDPDPDSGLGGIGRRKVVVDSVRSVQDNVLLIDAGDAVQGSLFFMLFGGEVEQKMMNLLGYDMAILGNHEFDNGTTRLAQNLSGLNAELLASNYTFDGSALDGLFLPYSIRQYGDKKIAFIALNIDPDGLIDSSNTTGVVYHDALAAANRLSRLLKTKEGADMVVALTHIGYTSDADTDDAVIDPNIARGTSDIDIIIGGHSHTRLLPGSPETKVVNLVGDTVLITQTGKNGLYLGEIDIDLDTMTPSYRLIPIGSRLDASVDPAVEDILGDYRQKVDSISSIAIGTTKYRMDDTTDYLLNLASDIVVEHAATLTPDIPIDFAVMNKGGLRKPLPKGTVTMGDIMNIFPFDNRVVVLEMTGADVRRLFDAIAARGGNGVSSAVDIKMDKSSGTCSSITIDGKPLDDNAVYHVATIDYLAKGNDYMTPFKGQKQLARSGVPLYSMVIEWIQGQTAKRRPITSDKTVRMHY